MSLLNLNEIYKTIYHPIFIGWINGEVPNEVMADWAAEHGMPDFDCFIIRHWENHTSKIVHDVSYRLGKLCSKI